MIPRDNIANVWLLTEMAQNHYGCEYIGDSGLGIIGPFCSFCQEKALPVVKSAYILNETLI